MASHNASRTGHPRLVERRDARLSNTHSEWVRFQTLSLESEAHWHQDAAGKQDREGHHRQYEKSGDAKQACQAASVPERGAELGRQYVGPDNPSHGTGQRKEERPQQRGQE